MEKYQVYETAVEVDLDVELAVDYVIERLGPRRAKATRAALEHERGPGGKPVVRVRAQEKPMRRFLSDWYGKPPQSQWLCDQAEPRLPRRLEFR